MATENSAGPSIIDSGRLDGMLKRRQAPEEIIGTMQCQVARVRIYVDFYCQTPHSAGGGRVLLGVPHVAALCQAVLATSPIPLETTAAYPRSGPASSRQCT